MTKEEEQRLAQELLRTPMMGAPVNTGRMASMPQQPVNNQQAALSAQQRLLAEYAQPREFQAPGSFGEGVTNVFQAKLLRPLQESLGLRESADDQYKRLASNLSRFELATKEQDRQRLELARRINLGVNIEKYPDEVQRAYVAAEKVEAGTGRAILTDHDRRFGGAAAEAFRYRKSLTPEERKEFDAVQQQGRAVTNINTTQNYGSKAAIDSIVDQTTELRTSYQTSQEQAPASGIMRQLLEMGGLDTGFGAEASATARRFLSSVGVDVAGTSQEEIFSAASNSLVLPEIKKMGTAPTDVDLRFVVDKAPTLSKSVEGNLLLLDILDHKRARDEALYDQALQFREQDAAGANLYASNPALYEARFNRYMIEAKKAPERIRQTMMLLARFNRMTKGPNTATLGAGTALADEILNKGSSPQ